MNLPVLFLGILLLWGVAGCQTSPPNLTKVKEQAVVYRDSGAYESEFHGVAERARQDLSRRAERSKPMERLAIVFDIDETILSNWPYLVETDFSMNQSFLGQWMRRSACPPLGSTWALYNEARANQVAVFFITGRPVSLLEVTRANLRKAGFPYYDGLYMKPVDYAAPSVIPYKSAARRAIQEKGYRIIANIGDQWSDLEGGYAERTYKLPNPFYYIP